MTATQDLLDAALAGDARAAFKLVISARNEDRGGYVQALAWRGAPAAAIRAALEVAWDHDAWSCVEWMGKRELIRTFRLAEFPTDHLPATVTAWRGGRGGLAEVRPGVSWTLDRDIACWFAHRVPGNPSDRPIRWTRKPLRLDAAPIVLKTVVPRRHVLAHLCERGEDDLIVAYVSKVEPDPDPATWRTGFERVVARRQAERERLFARLVERRGGA